MAPRDWRAGLRRRCYEILERGSVGDRTSLLVDRLLICSSSSTLCRSRSNRCRSWRRATASGSKPSSWSPLSFSPWNTACASGWRWSTGPIATSRLGGGAGTISRALPGSSTYWRSCRSGSRCYFPPICAPFSSSALSGFSRSRVTRRPCARCSKYSIGSAARCSAAS